MWSFLIMIIWQQQIQAFCCCWSLFYIVLVSFPFFKLTHCACMWFHMSERIFECSPKWCTWQHWHGWCHMKLQLSRHVPCTPYNHAPCHFMQSHIHTVHACLAVTCHLHYWQNDWSHLHATAVTQRGTDTKIRAQKVDPGDKNSHATPAGSRICDLSNTSLML